MQNKVPEVNMWAIAVCQIDCSTRYRGGMSINTMGHCPLRGGIVCQWAYPALAGNSLSVN